MDAGIADTINRRDVQLIAERFDEIDEQWGDGSYWQVSKMADTLMGEGPATTADRAWLVGALAACTPGVHFDGAPAGCDWDNLFMHFRAEILARRDPKTPSVHAAETPVRNGVGSR